MLAAQQELYARDLADALGQKRCQKKFDNQFGQLLAPVVMTWYSRYMQKSMNFWERLEFSLERVSVKLVTERLLWLESSKWMVWTNFIPTQWFDNDYVHNFILSQNEAKIASRVRGMYCTCALVILWSLLLLCRTTFAIVPLFLAIYCFSVAKETEKARLYARIRDENVAMPDIMVKYRESWVQYITSGSLVLATIYVVVCTWRCIRVMPTVQGNLMPKTMADIKERDAEAELHKEIAIEQNWVNAEISPLPASEASRTATLEQFTEKIWKNLNQVTYMKDGKQFGCDICFMESNLALIPTHIWKAQNMLVEIRRGTKAIQKFPAYLGKMHSVAIPDTDLTLVYVPSAGSWADITSYLPKTPVAKRYLPGRCIYKDMRGEKPERKQCDMMVNIQHVVNNQGVGYQGGKYELAFPTFSGLCMAPILSDTIETCILGFHTAGVTGTTSGAMCQLTQLQYKAARDKLDVVPGVLITGSEGTMKTTIYDTQFLVSPTLHPSSCLNKQDGTERVDVYGTCTGRAKYFSKVKPTMIKETVQEICGKQMDYAGPKFHLGDAFKKSLEHSTRPSAGVEPDLLVKAVQDYSESINEKIASVPGLLETIQPLSRIDNVCGKDGVRFIDKMAPNTSIGYPLGGPKSKYITLTDPDEDPDHACPAFLDEKFWTEAERMEEEYAAGRRCHIPFKACLKDEPTPTDKDKVRVFQAAPGALQLLIRKYFLPVARMYSLFPIESECAVGINTMGPEFDGLIRHMSKFGVDRTFAGDYSKYDLRMPAQLILAAFDVMISLAEKAGYSERDIQIMKSLSADIATPLVACNGDLIQLFGSNPSGQNLTVYINSIVNSLFCRCAYFKIYGFDAPPFREVCALATYGDDVKGSVKEGWEKFNHISFAQFLAERDMVFTMPDKTSTPTDYMREQDADFLKRKSVYCKPLEMWHGALDENSIFKSLVAALESKVLSPKEQSMQNIDGALREWFFHGPDVYERRRSEMKQVAVRHDLHHGCSMLDVPYSAQLHKYCDRYSLPHPEDGTRGECINNPSDRMACGQAKLVKNAPDVLDTLPFENSFIISEVEACAVEL